MKHVISKAKAYFYYWIIRHGYSLPVQPLIKVESSMNDCLSFTVDPQSSTTSIWNNTPWDMTPMDAEFSYHFFYENGTLIQSNNVSSDICYDKMNCHYFLLSGHCQHYQVSIGEEIVQDGMVSYGDPALIRVGNCKHDCGEQMKVVISGDSGNDYITYNNNEIIEEGIFHKPTLKKMCLKEDGCFKVGGTVAYSMSHKSESEEGNTFLEHKTFGNNCDSKCSKKPILTESPSGQSIMLLLSSVSKFELLMDTTTPHYKAACWVIYDDIRLDLDNQHILQRYILALLYFSMKGLDWKAQTSFISPFSECNWKGLNYVPSWGAYIGNGVFCNEFGNVTEISLELNNLVGVLDDALSKLSLLGILDVYGNKVYGSIPPKLSDLKRLHTLIISSNDLSGTIPETVFSLDSMRKVSFHSNEFTGTIPDIHRKYEVFILNTNSFSGPVPVIDCKMSRLRSLRLFDNELTGTIPETIASCAELEYLSFARNMLSGTIPQEIFTLPVVGSIDLSDNSLIGTIPSVVANGSKITDISLASNYLTESIPSQFSNLMNLQTLSIYDNILSGRVPLNLTKLAKLNTILLQKNNITGIISFGNCDQFTDVEADCGSPEKVSCECCTKCHSILTEIPCSDKDTLKISFSEVKKGNPLNYHLLNMRGEIVYRNRNFEFVTEKNLEHEACVSPIDCFILKFDEYTSYPFQISIALDHVPILTQKVYNSKTEIKFGYYSRNNTLQKESCDDIEICEQHLEVNSSLWDFANTITRLSGINNDTSSIQYKAMCKLVQFIVKDNETDLLDAHLEEKYTYYALVSFYFSTNGNNWISNDSWISYKSFCLWFGLSCDSYGLLRTINLPSNNLVGDIPSEFGVLVSLEYLNLDDNALSGTISIEMMNLIFLKQFRMTNNNVIGTLPSKIHLLENLVELDLSFNLLSNSLPAEIGEVKNLEILDLSGNVISGTVPNFEFMTRLKKLYLSSNLFEGKVHHLSKLVELEHLDLSNNNFYGGLPFSGSQDKLKRINLSGNKFDGHIPPTIEGMESLEILYLFNNEITGTIPNEIGSLTHLSNMSISHNNLKGTIPPDIQNVKNLKLLHLHRNKLQGIANYSIPDFITDCGGTSGTQPLIQCDTCTYCCNENEVCLQMNSIWPKKGLRDFLRLFNPENGEDLFISATALTLLIISFAFFVFCFIGLFFRSLRFMTRHDRKYKRKLRFNVEKVFQADSVYKFFLTSNYLSWIFAFLAVMFEIMFLCIFMQYSDANSGQNELVYEHVCPSNSLECNKISSISNFGHTCFILVVAIFLLPDFIDALLLFYESVTVGGKRGILASTVVMYVTSFSFVVQILYNNAIGIRNVDLLHNAVVVLFLDDLDEKIYDAIKRVNPNWVEKLEAEIETNSETHEDNDDDDKPISQKSFVRELNSVKVDIRQNETEIAANSERLEFIDNDDNYEPITKKNEMLEFRRELNNVKEDIRHIRSASEATLDVDIPSTEVMELKKEIHNLKAELRNIHHFLRQNLNVEGSMFENNRIVTVTSPGSILRQNLNVEVGSMSDNDRIETGSNSSLLSSSSMVRGELVTPKGTRVSFCKDTVEG